MSDKQTAMEYVTAKLQLFVDKYARVAGNKVVYSLYNPRTKVAVKKTIPAHECQRIYREMHE